MYNTNNIQVIWELDDVRRFHYKKEINKRFLLNIPVLWNSYASLKTEQNNNNLLVTPSFKKMESLVFIFLICI